MPAEGEPSTADEEVEKKKKEEEEEEKRQKTQQDFCTNFVKEIAKGMDGIADKMCILSLHAGSVVVRLQLQVTHS